MKIAIATVMLIAANIIPLRATQPNTTGAITKVTTGAAIGAVVGSVAGNVVGTPIWTSYILGAVIGIGPTLDILNICNKLN